MRAARRAPRARCASDTHAPERPVPCRFASARGGHATNLLVTKFASRGSTADSVALVDEKSTAHSGHHIGIAHTRWATHGGKTDENAHPHFDQAMRVGVVHNGTISNYDELRHELEAGGVAFRSETDTEVIAQLIGLQLASGVHKCVQDAVAAALLRIEGTWGLAVISRDEPNNIVVACNGSPMVIGLAAGKSFIASETSAFNKYTKNFIAMQVGAGASPNADRVAAIRRTEARAPRPTPRLLLRDRTVRLGS